MVPLENGNDVISIGEELRRTREMKGLKLSDVSEATKIKLEHLESLENDKFSFLPQPYIRIFLREYSRFVGLDPEDILKRYDKTVAPREPYMVGKKGQRKEERTSSKLWLGLGVVVIVILLFISFFPRGRSGERSSRMSNVPTPPEPSTVDMNAPVVETVTPEPEVSLEDTLLLLKCFAREDTWLEVSNEERTIFEGILKAGDERTWEAEQAFQLVAGRSHGVDLEFQGRPLEKAWADSIVLRLRLSRSGVEVLSRRIPSPPPFKEATEDTLQNRL